MRSLVRWWRSVVARLVDPRRLEDLPVVVQDYLNAPVPAGRLPWRDVPYTVLDIETSGLDPRWDSILAIGAVDIEGGRVRLDRRWYSMTRPPEPSKVAAASIRIHGLLRQELAQAPPLEPVLLELLSRLQGRVLVVHMAAIDVKFLDRALRKHFRVRLRGPALDTARIGGVLLHNERMMSGDDERPRDTTLRSLAKQAKIPVHPQHNALSDALTTAQLFLYQATRLQKQGKDTFHKLLRVGGCLK
ncbi:MAG: 3'-5' exonuclease [Chloroflexaceae bacterium]|nr:3'-5' exonuclease [Chloroflexaceae bacterium]